MKTAYLIVNLQHFIRFRSLEALNYQHNEHW